LWVLARGMATSRLSRLLSLPTGVAKRLRKWGHPLRAILEDYAEVTKELVSDARRHPLKTLSYCMSGALVIATWRKRPDYADYINDVLEYSNEIAQCSQELRNPHSEAYINSIINLDAGSHLRYISLGVCAVVLQRVHSPDCKNYHQTCKYLQPRLWLVHHRVVDVGGWGRWWWLEKNMVDFDVNEEQLEKALREQ